MRHHQGGDLELLDDVGDGESFAGAGGAEQDLVALAGLDAVDELADSFGLVSGGLEGGVEFEIHADIIAEMRGEDVAARGPGEQR